MTLTTDTLTNRYLFALRRYLGEIGDTTGTINDIVRKYKPNERDRILKKIALFIYGTNLPDYVSRVKQYRVNY